MDGDVPQAKGSCFAAKALHAGLNGQWALDPSISGAGAQMLESLSGWNGHIASRHLLAT